MKPILQHELSMVWRTENPNYIILIKNKAGKDMDFSQLKTVSEQPVVEKRIKQSAYKLSIMPIFGGTEDDPKIRIVINKIEDNREVINMTTKTSKQDLWLDKFKKDYKPLTYDRTE